MSVTLLERDGWEIVRITEGPLEADVLPAKGGDVLQLRWRDVNLLWESPWGLRPRSSFDAGEGFIASYPGGWQTIFPNGGDACVERGVEWGFHGEACQIPWGYNADGNEVRLWAELETAPFELERTLVLGGGGLTVTETAHNTSTELCEAMWSHHPAFGAPLVSGAARIETGAAAFVADDLRDVEHGDLEPGAESAWPHARTRTGGAADLRAVPPDGPPLDRFGYLTGFDEGWASITNPDLGVAVRLDWDASIFGCAWYWLEARATKGAPWFGEAYVLAIEPASTWPGQGIAASRTKGNGPIRFAPGETKTIEIRLGVRDLS